MAINRAVPMPTVSSMPRKSMTKTMLGIECADDEEGFNPFDVVKDQLQ